MKILSGSRWVILVLVAHFALSTARAETAEIQQMNTQAESAIVNPHASIQFIAGILGNESIEVVLHNLDVYRFYVGHAIQAAAFKSKSDLNQVIQDLEIRRDGQAGLSSYLLSPLVSAGLKVAQMNVDSENFAGIERVARGADFILSGLQTYFSKLQTSKGAK